MSAYDRTTSSKPQLGIGIEFGSGRNAWNASSRIWGTGKSFLDAGVEDEPIRRTSREDVQNVTLFNAPLASPVRQISSSTYGQAKLPSPSSLSPTDLNSENALQSKGPWGTISSTIGFPTRKPLSPTKQRQNQILDFVANSSNVGFEGSSLFAGSAPDVEDVPSETEQTHQHRRAMTASAPFVHSPTRANTGRSQLDPQMQAFTSNGLNTNDIFSPHSFETGEDHFSHGLPSTNGSTSKYSLQNGQGVGKPTSGTSSYNPGWHHGPTYGQMDGRPLTAERVDQSYSASNTKFDDATRSLQALSFDQGQDPGDFVPAPRPQSRYQRHRHPHLAKPSSKPRFEYIPLESTIQSSLTGLPIKSRLEPHAVSQYGGLPHAGRGSLSPFPNEYRSNLDTPLYSNTGTPPTGPHSIRSPASGLSSRTSPPDQGMFDRKFAMLDHYGLEQTMFSPNSLQSQLSNSFQYEVQVPIQSMRMNPLAHPYVGPGPSAIHHFSSGPRVPVREPEQSQVIRSPLLEEFRMHNKINRRFELKDIYNYVVEFSGDQHGSRFIQQKLETANSDEKEQVFKEIQPNLLQLMTDVFGNYVIQKMFEHGNQSQKKILAHQMKGHVLHLSMQMYGCRVVQKAFEHVLTDQQASLVKELDGPNFQILKVVKDQNGNHVVQKAIERIPGEHIQFIVDAHRGQMAKMSTHQYGCRVVQRMLEFCQPPAKRIILDELLDHILPLISDSYGNYVVQHIIQNGEPRDRRQVVTLVLAQLLSFSKHKFASNIVEKSIDCADDDQRAEILRGLTAPDEHGVTPVLGLMRDQYGNYVLRKFGRSPRSSQALI